MEASSNTWHPDQTFAFMDYAQPLTGCPKRAANRLPLIVETSSVWAVETTCAASLAAAKARNDVPT